MGYFGRYSRRCRSGHWRARLLLRHGRGAARALLSCAGRYVSGDLGSKECPAGYASIEAEAACRTAAIAAGKTPASSFVWTASYVPRGCYYDAFTNTASFNTHAVGARHSAVQLLCAAVTAGAPLTRRRRCARAYTHTHTHAHTHTYTHTHAHAHAHV
jgi:hypothetical protein